MRLELSRRTDLAIRALRALGDGGRLSTRELAAAMETSPQYAAHVMAALVAAGWVTSSRGPGGGYDLSGGARDASVLAVIETMEEPLDPDRCVLRPQPCRSGERCALHDAWSEARTALLERLRRRRVLEDREAPT